MKTLRMTLSALAVLLVAAAATAAEKPAPSKESPEAKLEVTELSVHPALPPVPALKWHLLPDFSERTPGNAVPIYAKAEIYLGVYVAAKKWEKIVPWLETPLPSLPREEIREVLEGYDAALRYVDIAARRERCDWEPPLREEGRNVFGILLPEVQSLRPAARLVALRARLQIADKRYDEALASLRTGYAMARHVARQPFAVATFVGWSFEGMMSFQLRDLITQPGVPNMYWAIAALPHPLIDCRDTVEFETHSVYLMVPEMEPSMRRNLSPDQWNALAPRALSAVLDLTRSSQGKWATTAGEKEDFIKEAMKAAPQAKADLIAAGHPKEEVEAMVPGQAVLLDMFEIYEARRDDLVKWLNEPYWLAAKGMKDAESRIATSSKSPLLTSLAETLVPVVPSVAAAEAWHEARLAILQCVEAIRLYAATHEGRLPPSLDSIHEVPVPISAVTGKPFGYHLEGDVAVLDAEAPERYPPQQYRVRVAK